MRRALSGISRIIWSLKEDCMFATYRNSYSYGSVIAKRGLSTMSNCVQKDLPPVYVSSYYLPDLAEAVEELLPEAKVIKIIPKPIGNGVLDDKDLETLKEKAEILFCDTHLLRNCINDLKKIRWIQSKGAGVNMMHFVDMKQRPSFIVTRLTANSRFVGEYVMMHILALERNYLSMHNAQLDRQWKQQEMSRVRELTSLTMCLVGVGAIGKEVARRCKQLGMSVHGVTRSLPSQEHRSDNVDMYRTYDDLQTALSECDYICCAVPSTKETVGLLSGNILSAGKSRKPILISVGRGDIIDEHSIVTAIQEGWLGGAVLDVQPEEPLPPSSPLWSLPNVFISPHIAGYTKNEKYRHEYASAFVENYWRYCRGQPLKNVVDFNKGY